MIWMEQELREFAGPSPKDSPYEGCTGLEQHVPARSDSRGTGNTAGSYSGLGRPQNQPNSQNNGGFWVTHLTCHSMPWDHLLCQDATGKEESLELQVNYKRSKLKQYYRKTGYTPPPPGVSV